MLYVCVRGVLDDTWSCRCSCMGSMSVLPAMQMLYVCVLCPSCGSSQCCILHDLQFVNAGRGCKRRPYGTANIPNTPMQYGYKTQHSTVTALHTLNNTVAKGLNQMAPARTITIQTENTTSITSSHNILQQNQ